MADPRSYGYYASPALESWDRMQRHTDGKIVRPPAAVATDAADPWFAREFLNDPPTVRKTEELPESLRSLDPVAVSVTYDTVVMTWRDDVCYPYGYGLIVLARSATAKEEYLRSTDRSFRRNIEISPGLWSYYLYH
jgi:hypothetical protein